MIYWLKYQLANADQEDTSSVYGDERGGDYERSYWLITPQTFANCIIIYITRESLYLIHQVSLFPEPALVHA